MNKVVKKCKNILYGLLYGLKTTETEILTQAGNQNEIGSSINQTIKKNDLGSALMNAEVTQEVEDLRYSSYLIPEESKKFQYLGNGLAVRKENDFSKKHLIYESDEYPLQLIQENVPIITNIFDELKRVGEYGGDDKFILNCERDLFARYRIEQFTKKIVIKRVDVETVKIHLYASLYVNENNLILSRGFVNEIERIKNGDILKSDVVDIKKIWFITQKAFGSADLKKYEYNNIIFEKVEIYDGNYVLIFNANILKDGEDLTAQYYSKHQEDRYKNEEKKSDTLNLITKNVKFYHCSECNAIINEYDNAITKHDFGRSLCSKCLLKINEK